MCAEDWIDPPESVCTMGLVKRVLLVVCVLVAVLATSTVASARGATLPPNSAILEYTEPLPTGGGGSPTDQLPAKQGAGLPPAVSRALSGTGLTRHELANFVYATAPRSQRAQGRRRAKAAPTSRSTSTSSADIGGGSVLGSLIRSASGGGAGMGLALPLILVLAALVAVGALVRRRRTS